MAPSSSFSFSSDPKVDEDDEDVDEIVAAERASSWDVWKAKALEAKLAKGRAHDPGDPQRS